jgi:hypothetical protein
MIDSGAPLADHVAGGVGDDQKLFIERIGDAGVDQGNTARAKSGAVFQDIAANQFESVLVVAFRFRVQLGVTAVSTIFGEHPIECTRWPESVPSVSRELPHDCDDRRTRRFGRRSDSSLAVREA